MPRYKVRYLIIFLLLLALLIIPILFFLLNRKDNPEERATISLEEKAREITKNEIAFQDRIIPKITSLQDPKKSNEEKYEEIQVLVSLFGVMYSYKNDPAFREYINQLKEYTKTYLPEKYVESVFDIQCLDKTCTDSNPNEIKKLTELISNSDFPEDIKESYLINLKNANLLQKKYKKEKAFYYYQIYTNMDSNSIISSSSALTEIKNELLNTLNQNYSSELIMVKEESKSNNIQIKK